jgi:glycerol-3-phosphate dehydrogenase
VIGGVVASNAPAKVRLVQGSHIVVRKLYAHDRCYFFQNPDGRIIFAIPYEDDFTLIGTTDQDYVGDPGEVRASEAEIDYLCAAASRYFKNAITRADVVWTYSGVRPLYEDGAMSAQEATRDYVLKLEAGSDQAPLLNIIGGKITTYRRLAEDALELLSGVFPVLKREGSWTASAPLPGGDFPPDGANALAEDLRREYPFLDSRRAHRLVRHYGTEARRLLGESRTEADLGRDFGGDLTQAEVTHLLRHEFARCAEDIVWRRTKSGLRMSAEEIGALEAWIGDEGSAL